MLDTNLPSDIALRTGGLFREHQQRTYRQTDRLFGILMAVQWAAGIAAALWISPLAWAGRTSYVHPHVWAAVIIGTLISGFPIALAFSCPGHPVTRHVIAIAQMLTSALFIHLSGGRVETHFHVFGSLAFLAFYRNWRILVTATAVIVLDHIVRSLYFPVSIFGVLTVSYWRWLEHAGWVLFEDVILVKFCIRSTQEMLDTAERQAGLEQVTTGLEQKAMELEAAKTRAEAATLAKDAFLATMSHEIRTPMNGILGMNQLLLQTSLSAEQRDYAQAVHQSGESLLTILNDILDFSKIQAGKLVIEPIPFDLSVTVEEALDVFQAQAAEKNIEIAIRYAPGAPRAVVGDPGRIRQILLNLLGNALKFTLHGHVLVDVDCLEKTDTNALLKISVRDTGIGIPQEQLSSLFQEFTQADASTTRRFGGTGLGLAISKRLVTLMGGTIDVKSEAGEGSIFSFSITFATDSQIANHPTPRRDILENARVLVVDDSAITRRIFSEQLDAAAIRHACFASASEALESMRQAVLNADPFHLAIIDLRMSDMDGEQLGAAIQADSDLKHTSLMLVTGFGQKGDGRRFQEAGFAAYLTKPVRSDVLLDALATMQAAKQANTAPIGIITRHTLAESRAEPAAPALDTQPLQGRFLVAEDNLINQKLIVRLLKNFGCDVDIAKNGRECLDLWTSSHYDLIFMDCQMPEMDGFQATAEIRRREMARGHGHTPIIALTANILQTDRDHCVCAGMDDFLAKPIKANDLRKTVDQYVSVCATNSVRGDRAEACLLTS